jgi:hypothetical protein
MIPDITDMTPVSDLTDDDEIALAQKATRFLTAFRWCAGVKESYLAFDCGCMLGVFLFRIEPRLLGVDEVLWVVVGEGAWEHALTSLNPPMFKMTQPIFGHARHQARDRVLHAAAWVSTGVGDKISLRSFRDARASSNGYLEISR